MARAILAEPATYIPGKHGLDSSCSWHAAECELCPRAETTECVLLHVIVFVVKISAISVGLGTGKTAGTILLTNCGSMDDASLVVRGLMRRYMRTILQ